MASLFGRRMERDDEAATGATDVVDLPERVGPGLVPAGAGFVPEAPTSVASCGYDADSLAALVLKAAYSVGKFTAGDLARRTCLSSGVVGELLDQHRKDKLVEILGEAGHLDYRYVITGLGHERAQRLLDVSGYVGPAPVSIERYAEVLDWQLAHFPPVSMERVRDVVKDMVLPEQTVDVAGLACASSRSLFLFGPAGTGKTTIGHLLHNALDGELWIPHSIGIGSSVVRVFDPGLHEVVEPDLPADVARRIDRRWICVRRPFVVAGGELTLDALELSYSREHRYYEAPLHLKANGGIFLLDDLGYQRATPIELLSRWIFPLERRVDYLSLSTGQKMTVPFRIMLIISTNLEPEKVMNAAFLRRMGYRLHMDYPSADDYRRIFARYAAASAIDVPPGLLDWLLARYEAEGRPRRSCEPRDLIERTRDICRYELRDFELSQDVLAKAWTGYFGEQE
jgi:hypothetical protein